MLEVGSGPGFFTIPAAKIVGEAGYVYAVDINGAAVKHVNRKIMREGLKNVEVKLADASETGLPKESVDVAFLFSVIHSLRNLNKVLSEMHRVLKTEGILSVHSALPEKKVLEAVTSNGLFNYREATKNLVIFTRN